ncbi:hypothetical protein [Parasedimentitalea psychrophila]|uniref:hypothetical protein n=1 Tax=Parasedimentitalea psychrophila TaxID=2997337 RepID=UPI0022EB6E3F|nr:hypothetical protein [Parasedimentitalea psychrophila]
MADLGLNGLDGCEVFPLRTQRSPCWTGPLEPVVQLVLRLLFCNRGQIQMLEIAFSRPMRNKIALTIPMLRTR